MLDRLSKLSNYETLVVMKNIEKDIPPPSLRWLDRLRRMSKVEARMRNQGAGLLEIETELATI